MLSADKRSRKQINTPFRRRTGRDHRTYHNVAKNAGNRTGV